MKKYLPIITAAMVSGLIITSLFASGVLEFRRGNSEKNIINLAKLAVETAPRNESFSYAQHIQKGDEYAKKNMTALAINEYIAANQQDPENPEPYTKIGKQFYQSRDYVRAQEIFEQLLMKNPENEEAGLSLAQIEIMMRNPEKAEQALATLTDSQAKLYFQGLLHAYFGRYDAAKKSLTAAIQVNTFPETTKNAQKILSSFEEYGVNQGSQEIFLKTILAKNFNQVGQYTLSIPLLYNIVKEKKDYRDAWILLGYAYLNIEDPKNAIDALKQAKDLDGNKPETLFFLGLAYHTTNEKRLAINLIEEAIAKGFEPKIQAQQKLAELYLEESNYEKSALKYESVLALNDSDINYYIRPMWIYIDKLAAPDKALKLAEKAQQSHPDSAMAMNLIGWAQLAMNDIEGARQSLSKALQMDGKLAAAYLNLGKLFERTLDYETAKKYYRIALELGADSSIGNSAGELLKRLITVTEKNSPLWPELAPMLQADILSADTPRQTILQNEAVPKFKLPEQLQPLENIPVN
jgi:tetratricopeptide (TPR) repeat protein